MLSYETNDTETNFLFKKIIDAFLARFFKKLITSHGSFAARGLEPKNAVTRDTHANGYHQIRCSLQHCTQYCCHVFGMIQCQFKTMGNAHTTRNCYRTKTRNIWLQLSSMQSTER